MSKKKKKSASKYIGWKKSPFIEVLMKTTKGF